MTSGAVPGTEGEREPAVVDCACGHDHPQVPTENGQPLVCTVHKRHLPCRRCGGDQ